MAWGSTVPACMDGLVAAFTPLLDAGSVIKGPVVSGSSRTKAIIVGDSDHGSAVDVLVRDGDVGLRAQHEAYVVNCCIKVATGSTNLDLAIGDAFTLLNGVGAALAADQSLGRAVMRAALGEWHLDLGQVPTGGSVDIPFAVRVEAFTTPAR